MRRFKVIIDYTKLTPLQLVELARNSVLKMGANADVFVTPDVEYVTLNACADILEKTIHDAQGGDIGKAAIMNGAAKDLLKLLRKQAMYVEKIADGDEAIILKSGFSMSRVPKTKRIVEFSATNGKRSGEMLLRHKSVKGVKTWIWEYSLNGTDFIHAGFSTRARFLVKGLTPVTRCWFRSSYVNTEGQSEWSNVINDVVK
jgi:hypothetical protein